MFTTILFFQALGGKGEAPAPFIGSVSAWLWFTVVFANFAEALAEGRGKAQAEALRRARRTTPARRLARPERGAPSETVPSTALRKGDVVLVEVGEAIPADGEVIEGVASVDESAVTGESAPVIRESGGDRSAVTGSTVVLSDWLLIRITANPGEGFIDRMIALIEGARRQKTPERDRADDPARWIHDPVPAGLRDLATVLGVQRERGGPRHAGDDHGADRAPGVPDSDDDRRPAERDRHRGDGPHDQAERDRAVGPGGRGGGRRGRAAAGQDRHDHAREPAGGRVHPGGRTWTHGSWRRRRSWRRWRTRRRRAAASWCWRRTSMRCGPQRRRDTGGAARGHVRAVQRADADERRRFGRDAYPQGCGRRRSSSTWGEGGGRFPGADAGRGSDLPDRAARRWSCRGTMPCSASSI